MENKMVNLDLAGSMRLLEKAGYAVEKESQTPAEIGKRYNTDVYAAIREIAQ